MPFSNAQSDHVVPKLVRGIVNVADTSRTEEDLRIGVEKLLGPALKELGVDVQPSYERSHIDGRSDAVYGRVIIEYESVGTFRHQRGVVHAAKQLDRYLRGESDTTDDQSLRRMVGVGLDGEHIFFLRYRLASAEHEDVVLGQQRLPLEPSDMQDNIDLKAHVIGPYKVNESSIENLLLYVRAAKRRPLTPEYLADAFGPNGEVARQVVPTLYHSLRETEHTKVRTFFEEWDRIFGIIYGQDLRTAEKKAQTLADAYGIEHKAPLKQLLFAIHTYYALLMKFIAIEFSSLQAGSLIGSPLSGMQGLGDNELLKELEDLEDGGPFTRLGIHNFIEGDFFSWYLPIWTSGIARAVRALAQNLGEFEPATAHLEPEQVRDLLKKLYQFLITKELRHSLGEYYTPDWIADLVLDEIEFEGHVDCRTLDPACGSGTFLVLAIRRMREYADEHLIPADEVVKSAIQSVYGFDLNPLAVIAARTNYLLALGSVGRFPPEFEIPVYLSDSVLTPSLGRGKQLHLLDEYELPSTVGTFRIPRDLVLRQQLGVTTRVLEECLVHGYTTDQMLRRLENELVSPFEYTGAVGELYEFMQRLDEEDRDGIWTRIIKNSFAPVFAGRFDVVIGNPPWVNWETLASDYREATGALWEQLGLVSGEGQEARMREGKKDLAMLMLYVAVREYVKEGGVLGFVVPQTLFKTRGAGAGFRRFWVGNDIPFKVLAVNDMVALQPFEGATNKTATIVIKRDAETEYPVSYRVWDKKTRGRLKVDDQLRDIWRRVSTERLAAEPVSSSDATSPWITLPRDALRSVRPAIGAAAYRAREGSSSGGLNGVYWVRILERRQDGTVLIENLHDVGKKKAPVRQAVVEPDLVYPLLRGRDIERWCCEPRDYIVLPQSLEKQREGIPEDWMKVNLPKTYKYFSEFEELVAGRPDRKYYPRGSAFYTMRNVAEYTYAPYKVVWPEVGNDIVAASVGMVEDSDLGLRSVVPAHTVIFIPLQQREEADFVAAILNSSLSRAIVGGYITGHPSTHVLEYIAIPEYQESDRGHSLVRKLGRDARLAGARDKQGELRELEYRLDVAVGELWGISQSGIESVRSAINGE